MFVKPLHIHKTLNVMVVNIMGFTVFDYICLLSQSIEEYAETTVSSDCKVADMVKIIIRVIQNAL